MYQTHQTDWFILGFLACAGLVFALAALAHFRKLTLQNSVFFLLIGVAVFLMMTMAGLKGSDNDRLRQELKRINPASVSNLVVRAEGVRRDIVLTNEVSMLFSELQNVQAMPAHHSSSMSPVDVEFVFDRQVYQYRIARDSDRTDEYWVFETARASIPGREIGRIKSLSLGQVLNSLLQGRQKPQAPR